MKSLTSISPLYYYYRTFVYNSSPDKFKHYMSHRYLLNLNYFDTLKIVQIAILESNFNLALSIIEKEKIQILLPREMASGQYMSFFQLFLKVVRDTINREKGYMDNLPKEFSLILKMASAENQFLTEAALNDEENECFSSYTRSINKVVGFDLP